MEYNLICQSPWCKSSFKWVGDPNDCPSTCPKCRSFDQDLSSGVSWVDRKYDGSRLDGRPHPTSINIQKSGENKKIW